MTEEYERKLQMINDHDDFILEARNALLSEDTHAAESYLWWMADQYLSNEEVSESPWSER